MLMRILFLFVDPLSPEACIFYQFFCLLPHTDHRHGLHRGAFKQAKSTLGVKIEKGPFGAPFKNI